MIFALNHSLSCTLGFYFFPFLSLSLVQIFANSLTSLRAHSSGEASSKGHLSSLSERKRRTSEIEKATRFILCSSNPHRVRRSRPTPVGCVCFCSVIFYPFLKNFIKKGKKEQMRRQRRPRVNVLTIASSCDNKSRDTSPE